MKVSDSDMKLFEIFSKMHQLEVGCEEWDKLFEEANVILQEVKNSPGL